MKDPLSAEELNDFFDGLREQVLKTYHQVLKSGGLPDSLNEEGNHVPLKIAVVLTAETQYVPLNGEHKKILNNMRCLV